MYVYTDRIAKYLKDLYQNKVYRYRKYFELPLVFVTISKIASPTINFKETKELQSNSFFKYIFFACLCAN